MISPTNPRTYDTPLSRDKTYGGSGRIWDHHQIHGVVKDTLYGLMGKIGEERFSTDRSGMDSTGAIEAARHPRIPNGTRAWFGYVNCNSKKQSTKLFGGITKGDDAFVIYTYDFRRLSHISAVRGTVEKAVLKYIEDLKKVVGIHHYLSNRLMTRPMALGVMLSAMKYDPRLMTYHRIVEMERLRGEGAETCIDFLARYCKVVYRNPPITLDPARNQMAQLYCLFRRTVRETE